MRVSANRHERYRGGVRAGAGDDVADDAAQLSGGRYHRDGCTGRFCAVCIIGGGGIGFLLHR